MLAPGWESQRRGQASALSNVGPAVTLSVAVPQPVGQALHVKLSPSSGRQRGVAHST